jgi:hypothetical protein
MIERKQPARIFLNYRRDDTRWISGRLIDSLKAYFGDDRVFRDIESIKGGAEFGDVIETSMQSADAVIVLIGPDWLTVAGEDGKPRLEDPDDWVAREIASALAQGVPVYPVLVEHTPIPRAEDLPEPIRPLVERNAMSISETRWDEDVTRLAKIVGIDVPGSAAERTLNRDRLLISLLLLLAAIVLPTAILVGNLIADIPQIAAAREETAESPELVPTESTSEKARAAIADQAALVKEPTASAEEKVKVGKLMMEVGRLVSEEGEARVAEGQQLVKNGEQLIAQGKRRLQEQLPAQRGGLFSGMFKDTTDTPEPELLQLWHVFIAYAAIVFSAVWLLLDVNLMDPARRGFATAGGWVGIGGTLFFGSLLRPVWPNAAEPLVMYFGSTVIAATMFLLMNLSGFKAK